MSSEVGPPGKGKARPQARSSKPQLTRACQLLRAFQQWFAIVFWFIEQVIARVEDELERRRT
jgi:hypothetical protein